MSTPTTSYIIADTVLESKSSTVKSKKRRKVADVAKKIKEKITTKLKNSTTNIAKEGSIILKNFKSNVENSILLNSLCIDRDNFISTKVSKRNMTKFTRKIGSFGMNVRILAVLY